MCRDLRLKNRYKQREVAVGIGVKPSTYGNLESSRWMVIGEDRARRIADFYHLDRESADRLMAAWAKLPLSPDGEKRKKYYQKRNLQRSKAKHHDRLMRSLAEVLGVYLSEHQTDAGICHCSFDRDEPCEVCMALENLGLDGFTTLARAHEQLAALQDKLEAQRAAAAQSGSPP